MLAVVVVAFSFCITWVIAMIVQKTIGLRVSPEDEDNLDLVQEAMSAFALDRAAAVMQPTQGASAAPAPAAATGGEMQLVCSRGSHRSSA